VSPGARVKVELFESESIVARGRKRVSWVVRYNDAWVSAAEYPGATSESLSPGPGTVWERRVELDLPVGTRVCRIESAPSPEPARDALDYLTREQLRPRRRSRRSELVVGTRGELSAAPAPAPRRDRPRSR